MPCRLSLPIAPEHAVRSTQYGVWAVRCACWGLLLVALTGCSSLSFPKDFSWPWDSDHTKAPTRMTDMWSFTVLRQPGQAGVRGYGGRLMFYDAEDKAMKVDGTLTVYAFDARSSNPSQAVPERKFVFLQKDLPKHYSESKLGHSYSFWLPWDEVGGPERQVVLATRFENKGGQVLLSAPSRQILPGGAKPDADKPPAPNGVARVHTAAASDVRQVSHQEDLPDGAPNRSVTSATIDLPPSFVRQSLSSAGPAVNDNGGIPAKNGAAAAANPTAPASAAPSGEVKEHTGQATKSPSNAADPPREAEPAARSALPRFPARREVTVAPGTDPLRKQPFPGQWPSALPSTPRWDRWREAANTPPAAAPEAPAGAAPAAQNSRN